MRSWFLLLLTPCKIESKRKLLIAEFCTCKDLVINNRVGSALYSVALFLKIPRTIAFKISSVSQKPLMVLKLSSLKSEASPHQCHCLFQVARFLYILIGGGISEQNEQWESLKTCPSFLIDWGLSFSVFSIDFDPLEFWVKEVTHSLWSPEIVDILAANSYTISLL